MDKVKSAAATLLLLAIVACNGPSPYQEEMAQVDSLQNMVKKYHVQLDSLPHDSIQKVSGEVEKTYTYLDENYPDRTDRQFWLTDMNYLARVRKAFVRYHENQEELRHQVGYTSHQLETLYNSLQDGQLKEGGEMTDDSAENFLKAEAQAVQSIGMKMGKIYRETQSALIIWDSLQPRFDSIERHLRNRP